MTKLTEPLAIVAPSTRCPMRRASVFEVGAPLTVVNGVTVCTAPFRTPTGVMLIPPAWLNPTVLYAPAVADGIVKEFWFEAFARTKVGFPSVMLKNDSNGMLAVLLPAPCLLTMVR